MPETQEIISFDANGVCSTCRNVAIKQEKIDWDKKKQEFLEILEKYRGKYLYDCIVPFSGGKDSSYTVYSLVKDYGLRPLVVSFDHHLLRPTVLSDREKVIKKLGVEFLSIRTNWQLIKKMMRVALERKGDILWYQHTGIFSWPMHAAIKFNVPLVIWGEPSAEYTSITVTTKRKKWTKSVLICTQISALQPKICWGWSMRNFGCESHGADLWHTRIKPERSASVELPFDLSGQFSAMGCEKASRDYYART